MGVGIRSRGGESEENDEFSFTGRVLCMCLCTACVRKIMRPLGPSWGGREGSSIACKQSVDDNRKGERGKKGYE